MRLYNLQQKRRLLRNAADTDNDVIPDGQVPDYRPVVKLFNPVGAGTWLLTELRVREDGSEVAFGLADDGGGTPEMGDIDLEELRSLRFLLGLRIERDLYFRATAPLSAYAEAARKARRIVEDIEHA